MGVTSSELFARKNMLFGLVFLARLVKMYTGIERCFQLLISDAHTKCEYTAMKQPLAPDRKYVFYLANIMYSESMC